MTEGLNISYTMECTEAFVHILKFNWVGTTAAIIEHFVGFSVYTLLDSQSLNSHHNAMLLVPFVHKYFDSFKLWLMPWMVCLFLVSIFSTLCL